LKFSIAARRLIEYEKRTGRETAANKYGYSRAFTFNAGEDQLETLFDLLEWTHPPLRRHPQQARRSFASIDGR
jgi:hypothetical protein